MKIADVEAGKVYWHDSSNNWAESTLLYPSYNEFPVRIDDLTRYHYDDKSWRRMTPDERASKSPKGQYLRGVKLDSEGIEVGVKYVMARYLRAEYDEMKKIAETNAARRKAERAETARREAAADKEAAQLAARVKALGLDGIRVGSQPGHRTTLPHVTVSLGYSPEKVLAAILDRLEAAEARERAAFEYALAVADGEGTRYETDNDEAWTDYVNRRDTPPVPVPDIRPANRWTVDTDGQG